MGKLFPSVTRQTLPLTGLDQYHHFHACSQNERQGNFEEALSFHDINGQIIADEDGLEEESSSAAERLAQCISNCFIEFCFVNKTVDLRWFALLIRRFFGPEDETCPFSMNEAERVKAKALSRLMRK